MSNGYRLPHVYPWDQCWLFGYNGSICWQNVQKLYSLTSMFRVSAHWRFTVRLWNEGLCHMSVVSPLMMQYRWRANERCSVLSWSVMRRDALIDESVIDRAWSLRAHIQGRKAVVLSDVTTSHWKTATLRETPFFESIPLNAVYLFIQQLIHSFWFI